MTQVKRRLNNKIYIYKTSHYIWTANSNMTIGQCYFDLNLNYTTFPIRILRFIKIEFVNLYVLIRISTNRMKIINSSNFIKIFSINSIK
jgi:hypothetical protein